MQFLIDSFQFGRSKVSSESMQSIYIYIYICHFVPSDSPSSDKAEGFAQAVYDGPGLQEPWYEDVPTTNLQPVPLLQFQNRIGRQ